MYVVLLTLGTVENIQLSHWCPSLVHMRLRWLKVTNSSKND